MSIKDLVYVTVLVPLEAVGTKGKVFVYQCNTHQGSEPESAAHAVTLVRRTKITPQLGVSLIALSTVNS